MRLSRRLGGFVLLCAVSLSGCSWFSKKTGNEPMELVDFEQTLALDTVWKRAVGEGQSVGQSRLTPSIDGQLLYAIDYEGNLTVVDVKTGKKAWSRKINRPDLGLWQKTKALWFGADENFHIVAGLAAEHGMIFVASRSGEVLALDQQNGDEIWRKSVVGEVLSAPKSNGNIVALQTVNGKLVALDAKTGEQKWFYDNPPPVLTLRGTPSPIVTGSAVYAGFANGRVMAFNAQNGVILWEQRIAVPKGRSDIERMVDIHSSPIERDGVIYVGTYQGKVAALARGTGKPLWAVDASTSESPTIGMGNVYVTQADGSIIALNQASGQLVWKNEQLLRRGVNGTQIFGDYVAAVDAKGYLHVMNQSDGTFVTRKRIDRKGVRAPIQSDGDVLYIYSNGGKLLALTAKPKN